ncbi:MAG TPA: hypothetical protein VFU88_09105 [Ktedonobacterales bacterium]|nr:hypothetical protein [Ktedonobacterales bacterium]
MNNRVAARLWTAVSRLAGEPIGIVRWVRGRARELLQSDWRGGRYATFAGALLVVASFTTASYYANQSTVPHDPDSVEYIHVAHQITHGRFVDPVRTPSYPLFIDTISAISGRHGLLAVSLAQGGLFVLAMLGIYVLACLLLRRALAAFAVSLIPATNSVIISYVMPIMPEGLVLFLLVGLALVLAWHVYAPHPAKLWLGSALLLMIAMARAEWVFFGLFLLGFLLLAAARSGAARRHLPHSLAALVLFYAICGGYAYANGQLNGVFGFSRFQNVNLLGKVIQYHMQDEAPAQYAWVSQLIDVEMASGESYVWTIVYHHPVLQQRNYQLCRQFALAIIVHHPIEFAVKSVPLVFESLATTSPHQPSRADAPLSAVVGLLRVPSTLFLYSLVSFPLLAVGWWIYAIRRRKALDAHTMLVSGLGLVAFFGLTITTLGSYSQYARMNAPYDALMMVVVWGSLSGMLVAAGRVLVQRTRRPPS